MGGVGDDGQVAQFLEHGNGVDVEGVARGGLVGADTALADHDVHVAAGEDVFGAHEQFLDGAADAALEEDRFFLLAQRLEQRVVLRVARPHLEDVGVLADQRDVLGAHHLGDDGQAGLLARLGQEFQPLLAQALEAVGTRARLEGAATQDGRAGRLDRVRRLQDHCAALHAARTGHDDDFGAADLHAVDVDDRVRLAEVAAGQLVRLHDAHGTLDAIHHLKGAILDEMLVGADNADNRARLAAAEVHLVAQLLHAADNSLDILRLGVGFHDDDHLYFLLIGSICCHTVTR